MPTYDYRCEKCGDDLEVYQSFSEAPLTKHKGCGGKLVKVLSPAGIVLKGSGFYKTDNRGSSKSTSKDKSTESTSTSSSDTSTKTSEKKSETKTDSKAKPDSSTSSKSSDTAKSA